MKLIIVFERKKKMLKEIFLFVKVQNKQILICQFKKIKNKQNIFIYLFKKKKNN